MPWRAASPVTMSPECFVTHLPDRPTLIRRIRRIKFAPYKPQGRYQSVPSATRMEMGLRSRSGPLALQLDYRPCPIQAVAYREP
jgi:hypothetical protein